MNIGDKIRLVAEKLNVNLIELANMLGVSNQNLSHYINGNRKFGKIYLRRFEKIGINTDWLINDKGDIFIDNNLIDNSNISNISNNSNKYVISQIKNLICEIDNIKLRINELEHNIDIKDKIIEILVNDLKNMKNENK